MIHVPGPSRKLYFNLFAVEEEITIRARLSTPLIHSAVTYTDLASFPPSNGELDSGREIRRTMIAEELP